MHDDAGGGRAVVAAMATAAALGLAVEDATVLSDSNRLVVRLTPCDVVARVTPMRHFASAQLELDLARQLARTDAPLATLDVRVEPRAVERDGFQITLWTHYEPAAARELPPAEYVHALVHLHAGLRQVELLAPSFRERVAAVNRDAADRGVTPDLTASDRALLVDTLSDLTRSITDRRAPEQLLHGEPHPWNVLDTTSGLRFIDFENAARGPVEYDLAWVPDEVTRRYPNADQTLVGECRGLVLAIIATHRWRHDDRHPSGRASGVAFLDALRDGPPWPALDVVAW